MSISFHNNSNFQCFESAGLYAEKWGVQNCKMCKNVSIISSVFIRIQLVYTSHLAIEEHSQSVLTTWSIIYMSYYPNMSMYIVKATSYNQ